MSTPARYWRHAAVCSPNAGVHLGCEHAWSLPFSPPDVMPAPPRMCKRKLHDLTDPANRDPGRSGCRPCRLSYQSKLRRGVPVERIKAPVDGGYVYAGPKQLSAGELAKLRALVACRCCGACPQDTPSGRVVTSHRKGCTAEP